jgi:hypothetical protein
MLQPYLPSIVTNLIQLHLLDSDQYVAKRFYQLETDAVDSAISLDDNRVEVESEVIRLAQGKWFLDAFYRFCKGHKEVSVDPSKCPHELASKYC